MKKILLAITFSIFSIVTFGQTVTYGVKGGLNLSTQINNNNTSEKKNLPGLQVGGLINIGFKNFDIRPELLFISKGMRIYNTIEWTKEYYEYKSSYNYIEIPIKAFYHFDAFDDLRIYAGLGPYVAYALSGSYYSNTHGGGAMTFGSTGVQRPDYGVTFSGGFEVKKRFLISVDYDLGVKNILRSSPGVTGYVVKNKTLGLSVGYLFK
jgi:hypothetical protein